MLILNFLTVASALLASSSTFAGNESSGGGSRFYYDTLKIKALVSAPGLEEKFLKWSDARTLDAIEIRSIDSDRRLITYEVRSGRCSVLADLTWSDGMDPNYRVASVSDAVCK